MSVVGGGGSAGDYIVRGLLEYVLNVSPSLLFTCLQRRFPSWPIPLQMMIGFVLGFIMQEEGIMHELMECGSIFWQFMTTAGLVVVLYERLGLLWTMRQRQRENLAQERWRDDALAKLKRTNLTFKEKVLFFVLLAVLFTVLFFDNSSICDMVDDNKPGLCREELTCSAKLVRFYQRNIWILLCFIRDLVTDYLCEHRTRILLDNHETVLRKEDQVAASPTRADEEPSQHASKPRLPIYWHQNHHHSEAADVSDEDEIYKWRLPLPGISVQRIDDQDFGGDHGALHSTHASKRRRLDNDDECLFRHVEGCCAICLGAFCVEERIVWSPNFECVHCFHRECLQGWLERPHQRGVPSCPTCRRPFTKKRPSPTDAYPQEPLGRASKRRRVS